MTLKEIYDSARALLDAGDEEAWDEFRQAFQAEVTALVAEDIGGVDWQAIFDKVVGDTQ